MMPVALTLAIGSSAHCRPCAACRAATEVATAEGPPGGGDKAPLASGEALSTIDSREPVVRLASGGVPIRYDGSTHFAAPLPYGSSGEQG
jgi:hypothetical protein